MPEIWVTYEELATLFGCTEVTARKLALKQRLDRKTGKDGKSRVQLCSVGVAVFAQKLRAPNEALDQAVEQQHSHIKEMKASFTKFSSYYPWIN